MATRLNNEKRSAILRWAAERLSIPANEEALAKEQKRTAEFIVRKFMAFHSKHWSKDQPAMQRWSVLTQPVSRGYMWSSDENNKPYVIVDLPDFAYDPETKQSLRIPPPGAELCVHHMHRGSGLGSLGLSWKGYRKWEVRLPANVMVPHSNAHIVSYERLKKSAKLKEIRGQRPKAVWLTDVDAELLHEFLLHCATNFEERRQLVESVKNLLINSTTFEAFVEEWPEGVNAAGLVGEKPPPTKNLPAVNTKILIANSQLRGFKYT